MDSRSNRLAAKFQWRWQEATVLRVKEDILELKLLVPVKRGKDKIVYARGNVPQIVPSSDDFENPIKEQDVIQIFITSPVTGSQDTWFASTGLLADQVNNPWVTGGLQQNDEVLGKVVAFIEDYGALVRLDQNITQSCSWVADSELTAFLHRSETPAPDNNIRDLLHFGDVVKATIASTDEEKMRVRISVNKLLKRIEQEPVECGLRDTRNKRKIDNNKTSRKNRVDAPYQRKKILLIDDDLHLSQRLQQALSNYAVQLRYIQSPSQWKEEAEFVSDADAILLDFDLQNVNQSEWNRFAKIVSTWKADGENRVAAIFSAQPIQKVKPYLLKNWHIIRKPCQPSKIRIWLDTKEINGASYQTINTNHWRSESTDKLVVSRANLLLEECCAKTGSEGALWFFRQRPGHYEIRAQTYACPQISDDASLENSAIETCISTNKIVARPLSPSDPLKIFAPENAQHFSAHPLSVDGETYRALLFYSSKPFAEESSRIIQDQMNHAEDIAMMLRMNNALKNAEQYAIQGMLEGAETHEIRNLASGFISSVDVVDQYLSRKNELINLDTLRQDVRDLIEATQSLFDVAESGLDRVRAEQSKQIDIVDLVCETVEFMRKTAERQANINIVLTKDSLTESVVLPLYRKQVELPLINLIDNAIKHSTDGSQIHVSLTHNSKDNDHPYSIFVKDFGGGIRFGDITKIFEPSYTTLGERGAGLGLYLSKQLLAEDGGKIELVETVAWLGTRFRIALPDQQIGGN